MMLFSKSKKTKKRTTSKGKKQSRAVKKLKQEKLQKANILLLKKKGFKMRGYVNGIASLYTKDKNAFVYPTGKIEINKL